MATVVKVPKTGRAIISDRIKGGGTEPAKIKWGTGNTAPDDDDGATYAATQGLETPSAEAEVAGVTSVQTTTFTDDTYRVVGTITSAGVQDITEARLANDAGALFLRGTFPAISLTNGDSIQFTMEAQGLAP